MVMLFELVVLLSQIVELKVLLSLMVLHMLAQEPGAHGTAFSADGTNTDQLDDKTDSTDKLDDKADSTDQVLLTKLMMLIRSWCCR